MLRDLNRWQTPAAKPLFGGALFFYALVSGALIAIDLMLWAWGGLPRSALELKMLVLTPAFVFFVIAWLVRWHGYGWKWVWTTFVVLALLGLFAAYNGYVAALDQALMLFVP